MSELEVDLIQPVIAFRAWRPIAYGDHWLLGSTGNNYAWVPGLNKAKCEYGCKVVPAPSDTAAVGGTCSCGFNAWFDPEAAPLLGPVQGAIVVHGRVEVHKDGLRAEYARIVALAASAAPSRRSPLREPLRRRAAAFCEHYGVPMVSIERLPEMAEAKGIYLPDEYRLQVPTSESKARESRRVAGAAPTPTTTISGGTLTITRPLVLPPGSTITGARLTAHGPDAPPIVMGQEKQVKHPRLLWYAACVGAATALAGLIGGIAHGIA